MNLHFSGEETSLPTELWQEIALTVSLSNFRLMVSNCRYEMGEGKRIEKWNRKRIVE